MLDVMLPAPGELDDREIIMRAFLLDVAELIPQFAVSQKEAQPFAVISVAILLQHFLDVHCPLLKQHYKDLASITCIASKPYINLHRESIVPVIVCYVVWKMRHNEAISTHGDGDRTYKSAHYCAI
jgi:hypothetical protein